MQYVDRSTQLVVNHPDNLARLLDATRDNPNELTIARDVDGRVIVGIADRDDGNTELWITVDGAQLAAALAITAVAHVSQD